MTETTILLLQFVASFCGVVFAIGAAYMALRAKVQANTDSIMRVSNELAQHEAACREQRGRMWGVLDELRQDNAVMKAKIEAMDQANTTHYGSVETSYNELIRMLRKQAEGV